jgi:hypothetical protein
MSLVAENLHNKSGNKNENLLSNKTPRPFIQSEYKIETSLTS